MEARSSVAAGDERAAARAYREAVAEGDPDAALEYAIWRAGGEPRWIDELTVRSRARLELELGEVNAIAHHARGLYIAAVIGLGLGAVLAAGGAINALRGLCLGFGGPCPPPPDYGVSNALYAVGASVGAIGLVLVFVGVGLDADSGARRARWRESARPSAGAGAAVALRLSGDADGLSLGATGAF